MRQCVCVWGGGVGEGWGGGGGARGVRLNKVRGINSSIKYSACHLFFLLIYCPGIARIDQFGLYFSVIQAGRLVADHFVPL